MVRKCIVYILVIAFLLYDYGCVKIETQKVLKDDPFFTTEIIRSVVLRTGEEILFDDDGGRYNTLQSISGTTREGVAISFQLKNVIEGRINSVPTVPIDSVMSAPITEIIFRNNILFSFNSDGGRFDSTKKIIKGVLKTGSPFVIASTIIREVRLTRPIAIADNILRSDTLQRYAEIITAPNNHIYIFDNHGGTVSPPIERICGRTKDSNIMIQVDPNQVLYAQIERVNVGLSIVSTIGALAIGAGLVVLIVLAMKESCPFVYSFDGKKYTFDAEPLGGATSKCWERRDYSKLEHLKATDGKYQLLVRNEVNETQYIDGVSLLVFDHDSTTTIIANGGTGFVAINAPVAPISAEDETGTSILPFVASRDNIAWQTHLQSHIIEHPKQLRHDLTFRFLVPAGAKRAMLVSRIGTTTWGSNMIREMYKLQGDNLNTWYSVLDRKGTEFFQTMQFLDREELYSLKVYLKKKNGWVHRGDLAGGGPLIIQDQILPLNVSEFAKDTLTLQIHPPAGFWSIDYVGLEYQYDNAPTPETITLSRAIDQDGNDCTHLLAFEDQNYFIMPTNHESATLEFAAPAQKIGMTRTVFLSMNGYYKIHEAGTGPRDTATIRHIAEDNGAIIQLSFDKFREWHESLRASKK